MIFKNPVSLILDLKKRNDIQFENSSSNKKSIKNGDANSKNDSKILKSIKIFDLSSSNMF